MQDALDQLAAAIRKAAEARRPVRLRGGGTKDFYGNAPAGELLDTTAYAGIVDYEPTELVVTARCGIRIADLEAALREKNQMLAFEPPRFSAGATLGGCIAAGLSGPRRPYVGSARDFVLGVRILDGKAQDLRFGGRVMKNVAGYDVSRLVTGSLGTLGLITEVSLKVLPIPAGEITLRLAMDQAKAVETMNAWGGKPLPLSATAWHDGALWVRLSGAQAGVRAARESIGGDEAAEGAAFWERLREQTHPFFTGEGHLWRLSVKSTTPPMDLPGAQLVEWGGAQRWLRSTAEPPAIRAAASAAGGHATHFRGLDKSMGAFHPLPPAMLALHRRLKRAFDPEGILNPGRMYKDL